MTILMVSCSFPEDIKLSVHGIFQRMNMFVEALKPFGDLEILFYVSPKVDVSSEAKSRYEKILSEHYAIKIRLSFCHTHRLPIDGSRRRYPWKGFSSIFKQFPYIETSMQKQVAAFENCLKRNPSTIFAQGLKALCPILLSRGKLPPLLFDINDIPHILLLRSTVNQRPLEKGGLLSLFKIPAICFGEKRALRKAQATFTCSASDKKYLEKRYRCSRVIVAPNSVEIPEVEDNSQGSNLLFIGSYGYRPNVFAAEYLIEKIWPRIRNHIPGARLILAGKSPENIRFYADNPPGIEFPGFVEDLSRLYKRTRIVCVPINAGGGTRIKILEAAAYAKPIVTTPIGVEGIPMRHGQELLICEKPAEFSDACLRLLNDAAFCRRLGENGRNFVKRFYDRKVIIPELSSDISKYILH